MVGWHWAECTRVNKRLAEKIVKKRRMPYASVMTCNTLEQRSYLPF